MGTGNIALCTGDWGQARTDFERAVAISHAIGPSRASKDALVGLAQLCLLEDEWDEAEHYVQASKAVAETNGALTALRLEECLLAQRELLAGQPDAARTRLAALLAVPG